MEDLFGCIETLPLDVQAVIENFIEADEYSYDSCGDLVHDLNQLGYTCDYGLDASPYHLTKL
jgi:hypothetical protein